MVDIKYGSLREGWCFKEVGGPMLWSVEMYEGVGRFF